MFQRITFQIGCGLSCVVLFALSLTSQTVCAQSPDNDFSMQSFQEKLSPKNWFRKSAASAKQQVQQTQPTPLTVIDRATAQRMASENAQRASTNDAPRHYQTTGATDPTQATQTPLQVQQPVFRQPEPNHPITSRDRHPGEIQQTAFQQPAPRVYTSPSNHALPFNGYPPANPYPAEEYPSNQYPPNQYSPNPYPAANLPPRNYLQPPANMTPVYPGNGHANEPTPANPMRANQYPPPEFYPAAQQPSWDQSATQSADSMDGSYDQGHGTGAVYSSDGRGYLQNGSGLQGRYFNANPQTATERAIALQAENDRMREFIARTQAELDHRTKELANARTAFEDKEAALVRMQNRVTDLNEQLLRKSSELKLAIKEKEDIQQRADETLKNIEANLDGVLMNTISRSGTNLDR